jgi:hypothetical protein
MKSFVRYHLFYNLTIVSSATVRIFTTPPYKELEKLTATVIEPRLSSKPFRFKYLEKLIEEGLVQSGFHANEYYEGSALKGCFSLPFALQHKGGPVMGKLPLGCFPHFDLSGAKSCGGRPVFS